MNAANLPDDRDKASAVQRMFGAIAPRYDLLNHLLSLNIDRRWRRRAVDALLQAGPSSGRFLDLCAGTFDLARELARRPAFDGVVVGSDFAFPMLARGASKIRNDEVLPACADALHLPFPEGGFDGAMVAFGVRNLADLDAGLREVARVLRPGGHFVVLEFSVPARQPLRALYLTYFTGILPRLGRVVSRHASAYAYLPASVLEFPAPADLAARMEQAGFRDVRWQTLTGGIAAVHVGTAERP
ncbi:MAG: ubiquinone/menaquinone biosynthesis methyltransferase [Gemmatimonadota bacterium]|jgi:demethylmenaquinone methyltransferase/2-methoxy-6-polyprenyl-1,4-benzoquinol methylase